MSTQRKGIAERVGGWSAAHRKTAILGWIAFVVAALMIGGSIGTKELTNADRIPGEAGKAERALVDSGLQPASEQVLIQDQGLKLADPAFEAAVTDLTRTLGEVPVVKSISSPLEDGGAVSRDGHSALVQFEIRGDPETAVERVGPATEAVAAVAGRNPDLRVEQFGDASANQAIEDVVAEDLHKAETLSLPITLVILVIAFGSLVAAGIPLLLGISAVMATFGLVALPSQLFPVDDSIASVILLIGLAVGIDYTLFYLRREREERRAGRSPAEALQVASATSGRAVLISGLTVMGAMAGLLLTSDATFTSFGIGTMMVVGVAMAASVTVLPAVLSALGDRVDRGRLPFVSRMISKRSSRGGGAWTWVVDRVLKRPALSVVLAGGALLALAAPAIGMNMDDAGVETLPRDIPVVQTYDRLQEAFPGELIPAVVVVEADDVRSGEVGEAIDRLVSGAARTDGVVGGAEVEYNRDGTAASITIPIAGTGADGASEEALSHLREELIPGAFAGADAEVNVTGQTASGVDFNRQMTERMPLVFIFVLGLAFVLMLVTFRSIVIPLKAIALNLLSVGAAYGALVLVFQHGLGSGLLGLEGPAAIVPWLPLFMFVILFGLSMDYHVFIVSRIREGVDAGMNTEDAVREGIRETAGAVTAAAFVMVAVFSIFATLSIVDMKQMGIGLAIAILIDATIVRAVLLPASMKLLGKRNWYLPSRLQWLPDLKHEPEPDPEPAA
ncbi:MAG: MMPL family transporter [Solirubrobacterales bacterium]